MAEDTPVNSGIPPRLDLRKNGIPKIPPAPTAQQSAPPTPLAAAPAAAPAPVMQPGLPKTHGTVAIKRPVITSMPRPTLSQPAISTQQPATPPTPPPAQAPAQDLETRRGSSSTLFIQLPPESSALQPPAAEAKKKTSRIPLEAAMAMPATSDTQTVRTVRIKPAMPGAQRTEAKPPVGIQQPPPGPGTNTDPKRKTSRISLEAAIAINDKGAPDTGEGPKTIRLKKPGDMATVKLQPQPAAAPLPVPPPVPAAGGTTPLDATAALEGIPVEDAGQTPTKRKTIKVRRPGQAGEPAVETAGGGADARRPSIAVAVAPVVVEDSPHWFFITAASIAVLVAIAVCLVVASQAIGPNTSGTFLSDYPTAWDINLPGLQKIAPPPR